MYYQCITADRRRKLGNTFSEKKMPFGLIDGNGRVAGLLLAKETTKKTTSQTTKINS